MNYWRRAKPSNDAGTCLWCGNKLRKESQHSADAYGRPNDRALGDYGDGHFCGLRCGYQFGKAFAGFRRRLNVL
jgi:hypothetical protein